MLQQKAIAEAGNLVRFGANLEVRDVMQACGKGIIRGMNQTPLLVALYYGKLEVANLLVQSGANLQVKDDYERKATPYINSACDRVRDKDRELCKSLMSNVRSY